MPHPTGAPHRWILRLRTITAGAIASGIALSLLTPERANAATAHHGPVNVLYAGSLVDVMQALGPAFERSTGYHFVGYAAGSTALASDIKARTYKADIFISAGTKANTSLEGSRNGDFESWYATFGTTPLVLGYNTKSRFAKALRTQPWYRVVTKRGFLLGRTDPEVDPKGVLTVKALDEAARRYRDPALLNLSKNTSGVFPEETLVGRLQAGQLDAGFFYGVEARAANLPTVSLGALHLDSPYTISLLNDAPDRAGAEAFVAFLLGSRGRAILQRDGLELPRHPALFDKRTAVPPTLRTLLR